MTDARDFASPPSSRYLDGELTVDERVEVEARLATSAELRAELDEIVARARVRGLPDARAPAGFWDAVDRERGSGGCPDDETLSRHVDAGARPRRRIGRGTRIARVARLDRGCRGGVAAVIAVIIVAGTHRCGRT